MQPLKLTIPGAYYDTQIYAGRLYLWCADNSLRSLNWDKLVDSLKLQDHLKLAAQCGFKRSDYLYGTHWDLIFKDSQIRTSITKKFEKLAKRQIHLSGKHLSQFEIDHQKNPIDFPHTDSTIYNGLLYITGEQGVWSASCSKKNKHAVSSRPTQLWDCPVLSVSASYGSLALSAGEEGLFEKNLSDYAPWWAEDDEWDVKPHQLSPKHSSSSRWAYYSIFSSSYRDFGYLADFDKESRTKVENPNIHRRVFKGTWNAEEIFDNNAYCWGVHDKLCQYADSAVRVVRYKPWGEEDQFTALDTLPLLKNKGGFVSAESAVFGFVMEFDNGLSIIQSDLSEVWIEGEPVAWRVFPKSKHYGNHLHVISVDHLAVYSFNNDYFVDQETKKAGVRFNPWNS